MESQAGGKNATVVVPCFTQADERPAALGSIQPFSGSHSDPGFGEVHVLWQGGTLETYNALFPNVDGQQGNGRLGSDQPLKTPLDSAQTPLIVSRHPPLSKDKLRAKAPCPVLWQHMHRSGWPPGVARWRCDEPKLTVLSKGRPETTLHLRSLHHSYYCISFNASPNF